jgi:Cu(I)/Ag(I) efflux system membrane protein CusA/SilA
MALMPIMWGTQTGSEVMKRIAAPMVGGLISSTILTLIIIPVVYDIWKRWELRKTLLLQPVIAEKKAREVTDEGD